MCPRSCCLLQYPPHPPSDGNKVPPREPLSPHRPLARPQRAESPRHTPSTLCPSSRAAATALAAFASGAGGQLLTGLAYRRRSTFRPSLIRSHTPTLPPPRRPSPREHAGRLGKIVEAGNRTTALLLRLFVVRFGWSLEVAKPPRKPWRQRRQTLEFLVCRGLRDTDKRPERWTSNCPKNSWRIDPRCLY